MGKRDIRVEYGEITINANGATMEELYTFFQEEFSPVSHTSLDDIEYRDLDVFIEMLKSLSLSSKKPANSYETWLYLGTRHLHHILITAFLVPDKEPVFTYYLDGLIYTKQK